LYFQGACRSVEGRDDRTVGIGRITIADPPCKLGGNAGIGAVVVVIIESITVEAGAVSSGSGWARRDPSSNLKLGVNIEVVS